MRLYFVRHGESEANVLQVISNRGWTHGLTEKGRMQVHELARSLKSTSASMIYSSPLMRAVETAELLSTIIGIPYAIEDALKEYDLGVIEGRSDPSAWDAYWSLWQAWSVHKEWNRRIDQGESFNDIKQRFCPFIEKLISSINSQDLVLILVTHGGLIRSMLPLVMRNLDFNFVDRNGLGNTDSVIGEVTADGLVCVKWGNTYMP